MVVTELLQQQHAHIAALMERAREERDEERRVMLLGHIAEELTLHATLEERLLYPRLEEVGLAEERVNSVHEHGIVKELIARILVLERHDPEVGDTLDQLEEAVREHVQAEEEGLFPLLFTRFERDELERIGEQMEQAIEGLRKQELLKLAENRQTPTL